jgi:hypothetical protein
MYYFADRNYEFNYRIMKNFFTVFICLTINASFAQTEFAPVGAKWYYDMSGMGCNFCSYYTAESIKDTLILDRKARIIKFTLYEENSITDWGTEILYSDSDRVYHFIESKNEFYTLFDFSANIGDTLIIRTDTFYGYLFVPGWYNDFSGIVYNKSTKNVDGYNLRTLLVHPYGDWNYQGMIIEGIGDIGSFFGRSFVQALPYAVKLRCYFDQYKSYRGPHYPASLACDEIITGIEEFESNQNVIVYPNPLKEKGFVKLPNPAYQNLHYQIIDISGKTIYSGNTQAEEFKLPVSQLSKGVYFLSIHSEKISYQTQKFIVQ